METIARDATTRRTVRDGFELFLLTTFVFRLAFRFLLCCGEHARSVHRILFVFHESTYRHCTMIRSRIRWGLRADHASPRRARGRSGPAGHGQAASAARRASTEQELFMKLF